MVNITCERCHKRLTKEEIEVSLFYCNECITHCFRCNKDITPTTSKHNRGHCDECYSFLERKKERTRKLFKMFLIFGTVAVIGALVGVVPIVLL